MLKEIKEHSFYDDHLDSEIVIIDLGACRGEFIEEMNTLYNVRKAILVEANPTNFKLLPKRENYTLYNNVISSVDGKIVRFLEDVNSPYNGSSIFNYFNGTVHDIVSISLNTIVRENKLDKIDILKIDIEGSEYEILEEIDDELLSLVNQITVEFHDFIDPSLKTKTEYILQRMKSKGFNNLSKPIEYMHGSQHYDVLFYK